MLYFALMFAAGFVLGTVRSRWIVPRLGVRTAELMEAPIMLVVSILAGPVDSPACRHSATLVEAAGHGMYRSASCCWPS